MIIDQGSERLGCVTPSRVRAVGRRLRAQQVSDGYDGSRARSGGVGRTLSAARTEECASDPKRLIGCLIFFKLQAAASVGLCGASDAMVALLRLCYDKAMVRAPLPAPPPLPSPPRRARCARGRHAWEGFVWPGALQPRSRSLFSAVARAGGAARSAGARRAAAPPVLTTRVAAAARCPRGALRW